jgi:predicted dehydrogenase
VNEFCDKFSIPNRFTDVAEMLKQTKPDLVHICTPPGLHCEQTVQCLKAGAWVFCEKPLCASLEELDRIQKTEQESGAFCSSVSQWRFGSGGQQLKKIIHDNSFGKPLVGICSTTWFRDHPYYAVPWRGKWKTELGGPTMGLGIHLMDLFLWLMGDWAEVQAMIGTLDRKIEVEDISMAMVRFENGCLANITNSALSPRQESYLRLDFQKATVELKTLYKYSNQDWTFTFVGNDAVKDVLPPEDRPPSHSSQLAALLDSMDAGTRPLVSGNEVRRTIEFLTSLYKSASMKAPVIRKSIAPGDPFYHHVGGTLAGIKV